MNRNLSFGFRGGGWMGWVNDYFHQFSETRAYPLAINIVFYLMTH